MYRRFARPGWLFGHLLVLVAALVCLRLGLWQWHRTHEATGTIQNLGYTFLWPIFAVAFVVMWLRFLKLEVLKESEEEAQVAAFVAELDELPVPPVAGSTPAADPAGRPRRVRPAARTESVLSVASVGGDTLGDDEGDQELAAYNRALAELADKDRRAR